MIVFDASTLVGAAIGRDSVPRRAVHRARERDTFALSEPIRDEVVEVLHRPRLARFLDPVLRDELLDLLIPGAVWFEPTVSVHDCRDAKDNKYLELALAAGASIMGSWPFSMIEFGQFLYRTGEPTFMLVAGRDPRPARNLDA